MRTTTDPAYDEVYASPWNAQSTFCTAGVTKDRPAHQLPSPIQSIALNGTPRRLTRYTRNVYTIWYHVGFLEAAPSKTTRSSPHPG